jgi:hypothetical protein
MEKFPAFWNGEKEQIPQLWGMFKRKIGSII